MDKTKFLLSIFILILLFIACGQTNRTDNSPPPNTNTNTSTNKSDTYRQKDYNQKTNDDKIDSVIKKQKEQVKNENILTADEMLDEFQSNQIRANKKFQNKKLTFKGVIYNISESPTGYTIIEFHKSLITTDLKCALMHSQDKKAVELSKGDEIVISGKCTGQLSKYDDVYFLDCIIK